MSQFRVQAECALRWLTEFVEGKWKSDPVMQNEASNEETSMYN